MFAPEAGPSSHDLRSWATLKLRPAVAACPKIQASCMPAPAWPRCAGPGQKPAIAPAHAKGRPTHQQPIGQRPLFLGHSMRSATTRTCWRRRAACKGQRSRSCAMAPPITRAQAGVSSLPRRRQERTAPCKRLVMPDLVLISAAGQTRRPRREPQSWFHDMQLVHSTRVGARRPR